PGAARAVRAGDVVFGLGLFLLGALVSKQDAGKPIAPKPQWTPPVTDAEAKDGIRIAVFRNGETGKTVRRVGARVVGDDRELEAAIVESRDAFAHATKSIDMPVTIDA